ncbi:MAG: PLDc_N domain-containing protein [Solirubrobacterales bacterium]|nr:PLDc_N domain-containing protein [Solirubrobacterales bacterium]
MLLASALAPGTVPTSSATDVYTEEPPPPTPNTGGHGGNDKTGGNTNTGGNGSGQSSGSGNSGSGSSSTSPDTSTSSDGTTGEPKQYSYGGTGDEPSKGKEKDEAGKDSNSEDSAAAVNTSGEDDDGDDGGSALPWIIAILIGVPVIGGIAYYVWKRRQGGDDETKEKLKSALNGKSKGPEGS